MPEGNHGQDIGEDAEDEVSKIIKNISLQSLGTRWKVLEIKPDIGEDRLVRIYKNGRSLPLHFFIQIKGQENLQNHLINGGKTISLPLETDHINDWMYFPVPVVIMVCDISTIDRKIYWNVLQDCISGYSDDKKRQKEFNIHIPINNVLDEYGLKRVAIRTKEMFAVPKQQRQAIIDIRDIVKKYQPIEIDDPRDDLITWETKNTVGMRIYGRTYKKLVANKKIKKIMHDENISLSEYIQIRFFRWLQLLEKMYEEGCDTLALADLKGNIERVFKPFDDIDLLDDPSLEEEYECLEELE